MKSNAGSIRMHNLSFLQVVEAVKQLSPKEKLALNEVLWEGDMIVPEEHQKLVKDRRDAAKQNPKRLLDWDEASKTLRP